MWRDSRRLDAMSKRAKSPLYPLIANQITEKFGIKEGIAIDVGTGPSSLSIALTKITNLKIYALDISKEMCQIAEHNIALEGFNDRIIPIVGDVHHMPFPDNFADLIFSRGSMFFWKDLTLAFKEIYRVLKPNGKGYIGGGFGSGELKKKIKKRFNNKDEKQEKNFYKSIPKIDIDNLEIAVNMAGIGNYIIINDDSGLWVLIKKFEVKLTKIINHQ